jgi:hypothetical protein
LRLAVFGEAGRKRDAGSITTFVVEGAGAGSGVPFSSSIARLASAFEVTRGGRLPASRESCLR